MPGRHRRREKLPIAVPLGGSLITVLVVAVVAVATGGGGVEAPPEGTGSPSATPSEVRVPASGGPEGAAPAGERRGTLVIHGTGDVSLDPDYIPAFRTEGYGWAWSGLGGLFQEDDLTVINLECPATDVSAPEAKTFVFRCDPAALPVAKRFGVEVANLANNHAYDHGPEGLLDSIRYVRKAGLAPVGAGASRDQALRAAYFDLDGWKVAVVGLSEILDPDYQVAGPHTPGTAAGNDFGLALRAIRDAARRADLVVVSIHWGYELDTQPREYQVEEAHRMIDAGADVILGHHAHRLQPMYTYRGRPIFYGLGNFVWPHLSEEGSTTAVARVRVTPEGRFRGRLLPASIVSDGHPVLR
ncbi:MAG TPA: CapA family protein [Actinomycetota bacterium]|nr:CapA family protein [Actinomycetota bacterium]